MNDFEKMQRLYEEGVGGASYPAGGELRGFKTDNRGDMKYSNGLEQGASRISYGKGEIPTVNPGSTGKLFTVNVDNNNGDEEEGTLTIGEVRSAIVKEVEDANPDCTFAFHELAKKLGIKIQPS